MRTNQLLNTLAVLPLLLAAANAQGAGQPALYAVSQPPLALLETEAATAVMELEPDLSRTRTAFTAEREALSFEYLRLSGDGTAFLSFDVGSTKDAPGGILVLRSFLERSGDSFSFARDYVISGPVTGLKEPKGLAVDDRSGVAIVTDFTTNTVKGFSTRASGNIPPLFDITDLGRTAVGEPRQPWGISVDPEQQRLFVAATDGTILVYDDYLQGGSPDRVIVPTVAGVQASANLHGVLYLAEQDLLAVTDFGPAKDSDEEGFNTDGKLFVIENASSADGETAVRLQLAGPNSGLGNPSDLVVDGPSVYVGDKTLDAVLRFDDFLTLTGVVDPAPVGAVTVVKPESLLIVPSDVP